MFRNSASFDVLVLQKYIVSIFFGQFSKMGSGQFIFNSVLRLSFFTCLTKKHLNMPRSLGQKCISSYFKVHMLEELK